MATLNLGRIKPVFRGAYSGSTAYVVDDIVTSGGSSYICIQAHGAGTQAVTVTAYWSVLASTGTDVGTTITTQGDILFRDGSGLQRLAKGTASQHLLMNAGATAPEWATVSAGGLKQTQFVEYDSVFSSTTTNSWVTVTGVAVTITPAATANKICGNFSMSWGTDTQDTICAFLIERQISGGASTVVHEHGSSSGGAATFRGQTQGLRAHHDSNGGHHVTLTYFDTPSTTSAITYQLKMYRAQAGTFYVNRNASDSVSFGRGSTVITAMEVVV